jgi:xanthine phosphoribosyltransferase
MNVRPKPDQIQRPVLWNQFYVRTKILVSKLEHAQKAMGLNFDTIIAVPRGGLVPAAILAHELEHVVNVFSFLPHQALINLNSRTTLVVDEICGTGATARAFHAVLPLASIAVVYTHEDTKRLVSAYGDIVGDNEFLLFPWEK